MDIGTSSVRAGAYTFAGRSLRAASVPVNRRHPRPGWAEQDPEAILAATLAALAEVADTGHPGALSIASTAVSAIPLGAGGEPLGSSLMWMDTRAVQEAAEVSATGHPVLHFTGGAVSAEWMLPKVMWLARNDPDRLAAAGRVVDVHDWVVHALCGRWCLARATATAEWCLDPDTDAWPGDLLDMVGVPEAATWWDLPLLDPGVVAGGLTASAASATGIPVGTPVVQGTMDSYAAAIAGDIYRPGRVVASIGTSSSYLGLVEERVSDPRLLGPVPGAFGRGTTVQQGGQTSAAASVEWFARELAPGIALVDLDAEAAAVAPGADGLWGLDTWVGCRTPHRDPAMRGMWGGLGLSHTRGHLFRATLEAVAFGGRAVLDTLQAAGVRIADVVAVGGGARSPLWLQIHADVAGRPLATLRESEPVALGAAMCAAAGCGAHADVRAAAAAMSHPGRLLTPSTEAHAIYEPLYARYLERLAAARAL